MGTRAPLLFARDVFLPFYPVAVPISLLAYETAVKYDIALHEMLERDRRVFEEKRFNIRPAEMNGDAPVLS